MGPQEAVLGGSWPGHIAERPLRAGLGAGVVAQWKSQSDSHGPYAKNEQLGGCG